nr:unnamed protein product [Callosobruchus chinensis]
MERYLHVIRKVPIPFHTIHTDHLGPFERVSRVPNNNYLVVIVDGFVKFCFIEAVKDTKMKSVIAVLLNIMNIFDTLKMFDKGFSKSSKLSLVQRQLERGNLDEMRKSVPRKVHTDQVKHFCFDWARKKAKIYKEGGVVVVVETDTPCTGVSRRLFSKSKGPCRITKMNDRGPGYYERKL